MNNLDLDSTKNKAFIDRLKILGSSYSANPTQVLQELLNDDFFKAPSREQNFLERANECLSKFKVILQLLNEGAAPQVCNRYGENLLFIMIRSLWTECYLIEIIKIFGKQIDDVYEKNETALQAYLNKGQFSPTVIEAFIKAGANPNTCIQGKNLLHLAIGSGYSSAIPALIKLGVDVHAVNEKNQSAIQSYINNENPYPYQDHPRYDATVLQAFIKAGASFKNSDLKEYQAFDDALKYNQFDIIESFFQLGFDVNQVYQNNLTLFEYYLSYIDKERLSVELVQKLIEAGANPNSFNQLKTENLLHLLIQMRAPAQTLLKALALNIDASIPNAKGITPLQVYLTQASIAYDNELGSGLWLKEQLLDMEVIKVLIKAGASANSQCIQTGNNYLHLEILFQGAQAHNHKLFARQRQAFTNYADFSTAVIEMTEASNARIKQAIIKLGISPSQENFAGTSPLSLAQKKNLDFSLIQFMQKADSFLSFQRGLKVLKESFTHSAYHPYIFAEIINNFVVNPTKSKKKKLPFHLENQARAKNEKQNKKMEAWSKACWINIYRQNYNPTNNQGPEAEKALNKTLLS